MQSFYHDDEIHFDRLFADKLDARELDSEQIYHIGTGQSSDSLMRSNRLGILDAVMGFARRHRNVILERFSHACQSFTPWHDRMFLYLCMENQRLWRPVFGFEYPSNLVFERRMTASYLEKIRRARARLGLPMEPAKAPRAKNQKR